MIFTFKKIKQAIVVASLLSFILNPLSAIAQPEPEIDPTPVPRNEFGHPSFAGSPDRIGNWQGLLGSLANRGQERSRFNIPESLVYDEVPF